MQAGDFATHGATDVGGGQIEASLAVWWPPGWKLRGFGLAIVTVRGSFGVVWFLILQRRVHGGEWIELPAWWVGTHPTFAGIVRARTGIYHIDIADDSENGIARYSATSGALDETDD